VAISIIELPALFALLAASPPAAPVRHGCQTAAPSDFDCCIHLAASVGKAMQPQHLFSSAQTPSFDEGASSDDPVR
jgi:hypothetical protein